MNEIRFRHYGYTVERLIESASKLPEGEEREALSMMIANNMKRNYIVWNQKSVTDEIIINDLFRLSKGKLRLAEGTRLAAVNAQPMSQMNQRRNNNNFKRNQQGKKNNNKPNKR